MGSEVAPLLLRPPHPIPYQGSKRRLAGAVLAVLGGRRFRRLYEPFAGSGAVTLGAAARDVADAYVLGDSLGPLAELWRRALRDPEGLADGYARLWLGQAPGDRAYYDRVRDAFNAGGDPASLLYLLARCVKAAPRFNRDGAFNQSPDRRRLGTRPERMRRELRAASALLAGRTEVVHGDFEDTLASAGPQDLAYLDPPWEGTTTGRDRRYHRGLARGRLLDALDGLARRGVPFLLSYDGRCGERAYGEPLPAALGLHRIELDGGRSSQATLLGRAERTRESLYLSPALRPGAAAPGAAGSRGSGLRPQSVRTQ